MSQLQRVSDILNASNLNWTVRKEKVITESGLEIPKQFAIVREDTNTVFEKTMGENYYPYQNHELAELLDKVSGMKGMAIHRGGEFKNGQRVYIQLKSNDLTLGTDRIEGYLSGINSFDGSTSLAFGPSNITISCQNTFFAAFREMNTKIRHTKNMTIKVDEVCRALDVVLEEEAKTFENIRLLSDIRVGANNIDSVMRTLFDIERGVSLHDEELISSRKRNQMEQFQFDLTNEMRQKGDNLWGLFSGVTKYTTHSVSDGNTFEGKLFQNAYSQKEQKIFHELVSLV